MEDLLDDPDSATAADNENSYVEKVIRGLKSEDYSDVSSEDEHNEEDDDIAASVAGAPKPTSPPNSLTVIERRALRQASQHRCTLQAEQSAIAGLSERSAALQNPFGLDTQCGYTMVFRLCHGHPGP
jgi:hypothetical protein